ncbi:MAG: shikimate dehydrogenase [Anaerolineae bacterium]|nr:shikimate dehydrogenase [Anaerolineae bacterium]MDW8298745.1 shikimate dehydrogenase [Anaerolineae bacterium]
MSQSVTDTFGFIIHPIHPKRDVSRKFPLLGKLLTEKQVDFLSAYFPPVYISEITGARSMATGREIKGWFIACPFTPKRMLELPVQHVYDKITASVRKAERLGAKIVGLGAFTSVVGDAGRTIAERCEVPVTTGDSYTIAIAVEAVRQAAAQMQIALSAAKAAVVGATGAIGSVCAEILAADVAELVLVGRRESALAEVRTRCEGRGAQLSVSTDVSAIYDADLILTVTSAIDAVIFPQHLKPGAVVCDVARPRDVSVRVAQERDDVLVIEGGMVEVPGDVDFHFDFGFPKGKAFACMAETMALAMEGRYEDYSIGKALTAAQANEIAAIAAKHGFRLSGFRSFERAVTDEQIERVLERAQRNRRTWSPLRA